jgi:hypothetical protein
MKRDRDGATAPGDGGAKRVKHGDAGASAEPAEPAEPKVDPLDLFMNSLCELEPQMSSLSRQTSADGYTTKKEPVILDRKEPTQKFGFLSDNEWSDNDESSVASDAETPYGGLTPGRGDETDKERELREESEHKAFMTAMQKHRDPSAPKTAYTAEGILNANEGSDADAEDASPEAGNMSPEGYGGDWDDDDAEYSEPEEPVIKRGLSASDKQEKKQGGFKPVDHSAVEYAPFRKKLYIAPKEIAAMSDASVQALRDQLGITVRGKGCPAPLSTWLHCGFSDRMLQVRDSQTRQQGGRQAARGWRATLSFQCIA